MSKKFVLCEVRTEVLYGTQMNVRLQRIKLCHLKTWTLVPISSLDRLFVSNFSLHQDIQSGSGAQWVPEFFPERKATGCEATVSRLSIALC